MRKEYIPLGTFAIVVSIVVGTLVWLKAREHFELIESIAFAGVTAFAFGIFAIAIYITWSNDSEKK